MDSDSSDHDLGIVALGGELTPETLSTAYTNGIFPWPMEGSPLPWVCPPQRAILSWENLHVPRSLKRFILNHPFQVTLNQNFIQVIRECQKAYRPGQDGTWITQEMIHAYTQLHKLGRAHSVEVWENNELIGGMYGVSVQGTFAGESMFYHRPNASKLALLYLLRHLHDQGLDWIDIQMLTPHMERLGAKEIPRNQFLRLLVKTQKQGLILNWEKGQKLARPL